MLCAIGISPNSEENPNSRMEKRGSPNEATSAGLERKFMDNGYTKASALKGGWTEWQAARYPMEPK
jgi:hypothetical protein